MSYLGMDTWDLVFLLPELNKEKQQMQGMLHVYVRIYTSVVSSVIRNLTHRNINTLDSCNHGPQLFQGIAIHRIPSVSVPFVLTANCFEMNSSISVSKVLEFP